MKAAVTADWRASYAGALATAGIAVDFRDGGDDLAHALADDWQVELVILDLGRVTPALVARLGPCGPRLLAFGAPDNAGTALGANLADFIAERPAAAELIAAVHAALAPGPPPGVADRSERELAGPGAPGAESSRIADALARLAAAPDAPPPPADIARLRAMIRARRLRDRFFPADLFGEPAWDMLLDLAVAAAVPRDVAVSSLCIAAAVPTTTALRWIRTMCDAGLFVRRADPDDARRAFISLSPDAALAMARYLAQTAEPWP